MSNNIDLKTSKDKSKLMLLLSLILSLICLAFLLHVNRQIAVEYKATIGIKERAMFGLRELDYSFKYLLLVPCLFACWLAFKCKRKGHFPLASVMILLLALLTTVSIFVRIWTYFV